MLDVLHCVGVDCSSEPFIFYGSELDEQCFAFASSEELHKKYPRIRTLRQVIAIRRSS